MNVKSINWPVHTKTDTLLEALSLGFAMWADNQTDEFSVSYSDYTGKFTLTTWRTAYVVSN